MTRRAISYSLAALCVLSCVGCIRTRNYHPDNKSTFYYRYGAEDPHYGSGYFEEASAHEAYVEFDARGSMYRDRDNHPLQLEAALKQIDALRHPNGAAAPRKIALYVFVHGWKNNASEDSGNVWGFRRFLSVIAHQHCGVPVMGVYIGWPGATLKMDKFLTFWNREPVADNVGNGELVDAMRSLLKAAKGPRYNDPEGSSAVVIGHSFGGIVLERVATKLLREQLSDPDPEAATPADLFVLVNEAGAAAIARPFLFDLADKGVTYNDPSGHAHPLLLSMTSTGDVATKFAYPGGEFVSAKRPPPEKYSQPDRFGQTSSLPYDLLTAANMIALQSHQIVPAAATQPACDLKIPLTTEQQYCMNALRQNRLNQTPYWIMQLPQVFVPDHSSVFQDYLLNLIAAVTGDSNLTDCGPQRPAVRAAVAAAAAAALPATTGRPTLKRSR